jgi:hypothetical protein
MEAVHLNRALNEAAKYFVKRQSATVSFDEVDLR